MLRCKRSLESKLSAMDEAAAGERADTEDCGDSDTGLLRADESLLGVLREIAKRCPGRPLIAYGSRVTGNADPHSDIDMLILDYDCNAAPVQETIHVYGIEIDITRVGFNPLLKGIKGRSKSNNNWFLNALHQCCIYGDRKGDARRLRAIAASVWKQGQPALTPRQLRLGRGALLRLQDSTKKLVARARDSPAAARLARMRCDQLVAQSIYLFYCVRRRWTTSFQRLIGWCSVDYPEFHALWLQYIRSAEHEEAISAAKRIVAAVHEGVLSSLSHGQADGEQLNGAEPARKS